MKILALERELGDQPAEAYQPHLQAEAAQVWALYEAGVLRECYFRADQHTAVLVLECEDAEAARDLLAGLPLVQAGLIAFELLPLVPYTGFARLFATVE
jgi:hypothetical protein